MMSTAILMAMGAEQSGKQPVAHDVENFDGPTFAQTLDARVGRSPAILGEDSKSATLLEASDKKTEPTTKNLVDASELSVSAKTKINTGQLTPTQVVGKNANAIKSAPLHPATVAGAKAQKATEEIETQAVEPVDKREGTQIETSAVPQAESTASLHSEERLPLEQQGEKNQAQVPTVQTPASQRDGLATSKAQDAASEKKTATKTQEKEASQPVLTAKNGVVMAPPIAQETKLTHGIGAQVIAPAPNPTPAHAVVTPALPVAAGAAGVSAETSNAAVNVDRGKSAVGSAAASSSVSAPSAVMSAGTDGSSSSKNAVHGVKSSISDHETTAAASGDAAAPAKSDVKEERSQGATENAGGDSDTKTRMAGEVSVATVHPLATGGEVTSASVATVVTGMTKLSGGEGSTLATGSLNGLREQDGSGSVAQSMEPMPRTLSATPTALEVGIPDGTHGWLKVRAEMTDGGVVNASVSAASSTSQEMLHRELPSLTAYLQSEKVAVNAVVVHSTASAGAEYRGNSAGPESGGSGQTPRQSDEGGQQQSSVKTTAEFAGDVPSTSGFNGVDEDGMSSLASYGSGGSWLSVRA